jgi:hypothetical protein
MRVSVALLRDGARQVARNGRLPVIIHRPFIKIKTEIGIGDWGLEIEYATNRNY